MTTHAFRVFILVLLKNISWVALMRTEGYNDIAIFYCHCILLFTKCLHVIFLIISPER